MSVHLSRESDRPHVAHLRLDFDDLNRFSPGSVATLRETVESVPEEVSVLTVAADQSAADDEVRGLSAGLDVEWARDRTPHEAQDFLQELYRTVQAVRDCHAVTVCGCGDYALGAGLELAMGCTFRVATADAVLGLPEVNVGIPTVVQGGLLIPLVGLPAARELVFTGEPVDGARARDLGLVDRVASAADYEDAVDALVDTLAAKSPLVMQVQKRVFRRWRSLGLESGMEASVGDIARCFGSHDQREAMDAFLDDREPEFEGR